jgi:hypothetical protein
VRVGTASRALRRPRRPKGRRAVVAVAFTALFFAGAAFTASAGDKMAGLIGATKVSGNEAAVLQSAPATAPATAAAQVLHTTQVPRSVPAPRAALASTHVTQASVAQAGAALTRTHASLAPVRVLAHAPVAPAARAVVHVQRAVKRAHASRPTVHARVHALARKHVALTVGSPGAAPIEVAPSGTAFWESVALPDPIPAALRLAPSFAQRLSAAAANAGVDWALVLAVARAQGGRSANPVPQADLGSLARKLASFGGGLDEHGAAKAFGGTDQFADRVVALARFDRAVGLDALVRGLAAEKAALTAKVLSDPRVTIYDGGRDDLVQGHVDVRVLAVIEYLAEGFGQVSVSSLITGHREWARPGVVSAHVYGRAVDVAALDGVSILGHQQRGSVTEQAVRALLLLPAEVEPRQIISLIGLGGPSFALADHYNHIHVGF